MRFLRVVMCCAMVILLHPCVSMGKASTPSLARLTLLDPRNPVGWQAVEATMSDVTVDGEPAILFRVPVDWYGGEKDYPIGWPRLQTDLTGERSDWSSWELRLRVRVTTEGEPLPRIPIGLTVSAKGSAQWEKDVEGLPTDQWTDVFFDLSQVPGREAVQSIGLYISEDNYRHGMTVSFLISELALIRYTEPILTDLRVGASLAFADAASLPLTLEMLGLQLGNTDTVELMLIRDERAVSTTRAEAEEGWNQLSLPLPKNTLPGDYTLRVRHGDQMLERSVRLIASPWQEANR
jgi:hypothetical protein